MTQHDDDIRTLGRGFGTADKLCKGRAGRVDCFARGVTLATGERVKRSEARSACATLASDGFGGPEWSAAFSQAAAMLASDADDTTCRSFLRQLASVARSEKARLAKVASAPVALPAPPPAPPALPPETGKPNGKPAQQTV